MCALNFLCCGGSGATLWRRRREGKHQEAEQPSARETDVGIGEAREIVRENIF